MPIGRWRRRRRRRSWSVNDTDRRTHARTHAHTHGHTLWRKARVRAHTHSHTHTYTGPEDITRTARDVTSPRANRKNREEKEIWGGGAGAGVHIREFPLILCVSFFYFSIFFNRFCFLDFAHENEKKSNEQTRPEKVNLQKNPKKKHDRKHAHTHAMTQVVATIYVIISKFIGQLEQNLRAFLWLVVANCFLPVWFFFRKHRENSGRGGDFFVSMVTKGGRI